MKLFVKLNKVFWAAVPPITDMCVFPSVTYPTRKSQLTDVYPTRIIRSSQKFSPTRKL